MAKSTKRNEFRLSALAVALCLSTAGAHAAGLGTITVLSPLGQPLRAEIDVNASSEELASMNARLASPEAFRQVGIEYAPGVAGIRFAVDKHKNGQPYLRVTSDRPINEPFLDVLVELTWSSGRMVREYTFLLDPPQALAPAAPVPVAAPEVAEPTPAPVSAPPPVVTEAPTPTPVTVAPIPAETQEPSAQAAIEKSNTRLVKRGDTLTRIALATKPEGVTLDQMLVALLRGNQDAFDGDNMNRLRAGKILTIPDSEAVSAVAPSQARKIVVDQARDFNAYRGRLAESVAAAPAKEEMAQQADQGKITPEVARPAAAPESVKDKLEVSRTEVAKDTKALQGRITALEEDLVARERALKEANSRVAALEANLADLKKLAELKSQSGAQLQQQAETAKPVTEAPAAPEAPAVPEAAKPAEAPTEPVEPPKAAEAPVEPPVVEQAKPVEPPPPEKAPAVEAVAPPPAPEEPSFIDDNPLLVYGGGGLLVLLLGYLGISAFSRRSRDDEPLPTASRLSEGDLMANSVFGTTGGQAVDTSASIQTDFSQASLSAIDSDEGVDPVAEADVYMAYGRDAQAEEILVDALKTDPTRLAIYMKLLEIYSGHTDLPKFEKVATDLHGQTGGNGPDWEKAAAMGRSIDPGNPLYAGGDSSAGQQSEPVVLPESEPEPSSETVESAPTPEALSDQWAQQLETDLPKASTTPSDLGFEVDLGVQPVADDAQSERGPETAPSDLEPGLAVAFEPDTQDIDLSLPDIGGADIDVSSQSTPSEQGTGGLDFEFDLDAPLAETPPVTAQASSVDFSGIDLDLVTSDTPPDQGSDAAGDDDGDVATKLELAQAYDEMGDREGARELLEEVLQEGNASQQELARTKLAALDA